MVQDLLVFIGKTESTETALCISQFKSNKEFKSKEFKLKNLEL